MRSTWLAFRSRIAASAPPARAAGSEVVRIKPGAWLPMEAPSAAEPAVQPGRHDDHAGARRQGRQRGLVRDKAGRKAQRRLAPVQIGELGFEQIVEIRVAGNVASAAAAGAERGDGLDHRIDYCCMLAHAEIVVRAPDRHLAADAVFEGPRKKAAAPCEIGEDAIATLGAKLIEMLREIGF